MRILTRFIVSISILALLAVVGSALAWRYLDAAPEPFPVAVGAADPDEVGGAPGSVLFEVPQGAGSGTVGQNLEAAGLIRSALFWQLLARLDDRSLKAGTYRIERGMSASGIRDLMASGKQVLARVTVPEGFTLGKIASLLEDARISDGASFLAAARDPELVGSYGIPAESMEGYLYPDTYLFPYDYPADKVVRTMADTFFARLDGTYPAWRELSPEELFERVVVASIVEREYRSADEAPLMAGVFFNRLRIGMALQSCATVEYVITEIEGKPHPEVLYNRDLAIRDPYNTYIHRGLPPGPISAPGAVALSAAFYPTESDYLYFRLVDPEAGRHHFSRTLGEHDAAGVVYVKRMAGKQ